VDAVSGDKKAFLVKVATNPKRQFLVQNDREVPSGFSATGKCRYKSIGDLELSDVSVEGTIGKTQVVLAIGNGDDTINVQASLEETKKAVTVSGTGSWSTTS